MLIRVPKGKPNKPTIEKIATGNFTQLLSFIIFSPTTNCEIPRGNKTINIAPSLILKVLPKNAPKKTIKHAITINTLPII